MLTTIKQVKTSIANYASYFSHSFAAFSKPFSILRQNQVSSPEANTLDLWEVQKIELSKAGLGVSRNWREGKGVVDIYVDFKFRLNISREVEKCLMLENEQQIEESFLWEQI